MNLWALDLGPLHPGGRDVPLAAHLITEDTGAARITACGQQRTSASHPRGWWQLPAGELPLQAHAVHCGAAQIAQEETMSKGVFPVLPTGDQPPPIPTGGPDIQAMVIADIEVRRKLGIARYGTPLQAGNGRDALRDVYEEALDLACYLRQVIAERDML